MALVLAQLGPRVTAGIVGIALLLIDFGLPIWAIVSIARSAHGMLRVLWIVLIVGTWLVIPLIGIILSGMWLVFKRRFIAFQRN